MELLHKTLESLREKLIDVSNRNKLINFNHGYTKRCVRVIDELPNQLAQTLLDGKEMTFVSIDEPTEEQLIEHGYLSKDEESGEIDKLKDYPKAGEWAKVLGFSTNYTVPDNYTENIEDKHSDKNIQTLFYKYELQTILKNIYYVSESSKKETGANILYFNFGFLRWKDNERSKSGLAPLYSIPVNMSKGRLNIAKGIYEYTIKYSGTDVIENLSLREKLRRDFAIALPEVSEDDKPESYLRKVSSIIKDKPSWRVERYITLGLLDFTKSLMYRDLNPKNWSEDNSLLNNDLVKQVLIGVDKSDHEEEHPFGYAEDYSIDSCGKSVHEKYPLLFDADSSQHSAIIDVVNGKNMVIEGPPGTGKSQTIANLIGSLLHMGKSVLFMAEKQAAINVVHDKLKGVGLDNFCLNIHGKADKKSVIESIGNRVKARGSFDSPSEYQAKIDKYEELKDRLNEYEELVNSEWKSTGFTVNKILTAAAAYREQTPSDLEDFFSFGVANLDKSSFDKYLDELESFANLTQKILSGNNYSGKVAGHPWNGFIKDVKSYQVDRVFKALDDWNTSLKKYNEVLNKYKTQYPFIQESSDYRELPDAVRDIEGILNISTEIDFENLARFDTENVELYEQCLHSHKDYINSKFILEERYGSDLLDNIEELKSEVCLPKDIHLIDKDLTVLEIENAIGKIGQIKSRSDDISRLINNANEVLNGNYISSTIEGLRTLEKVFKVVQKINPENINGRDLSFNNKEIHEAFNLLKESVTDAKELAQKVDAVFDISILPENHILDSLKQVITSKGPLKYLDKSYWSAKKKIKEYASNPYLKVSDMLNSIEHVKNLRKLESDMICNNASNRLFKYVDGHNTDTGKIENIINFYKNVEELFGTGFGDKFKVRDRLINLSDDEMLFLQNVAISSQEDDLSEYIENIDSLSNKFGVQFDKYMHLFTEDGGVSRIQSKIDKSYDFVNSVAFFGQKDDPISQFIEGAEAANSHILLKINLKSFPKEIYFNSTTFLSGEHNLTKTEKTIHFVKELRSKRFTSEVSEYILRNLTIVMNSLGSDASETLDEVVFKVKKSLEGTVASRKTFEELSGINDSWFGGINVTVSQAILRNEEAISAPEDLDNWVEYLRVHKRMQNFNLHEFCDYATSHDMLGNISKVFKSYVFGKLAVDIHRENDIIEQFSSNIHNKNISDFVEIDHNLKVLNQKMIASSIDNKAKTIFGNGQGLVSSYTEMSLITHEMTKQTRHAPLRALISRAKSSLQSLKPCFMMSPMSVSQYLEPGDIQFDVIIMDEASQIKPEDAIGTIARGSQVVIVGDPKQLPPTSFFDRQDETDIEEETVIDNQESILDAAMSVFDLRTLKWHYRSKHEDLIQFSNLNFYNDNLIVFPSPINDERLGIRHIPVKNGVYLNRKNIPEARKIAEHVRQHLLDGSGESLGVVAMNSEQQKFIESAIEDLERSDEKFSKLLNENYQKKEPLFIKNLENVQGDERDVMFISTTYGPETEGGRVMQRFGLRAKDGHRRLNVLLTRAKIRMHIFTSLRSSDVSNTSSNRGVRALNKFLKYCESGYLDRTDVQTNKVPDSDFEVAVIDMLERYDFECVPQVGAAGFFIDIAVKDPKNPGEFLMGIECDGATYHSSNSARDRDRLRQEVLEGLGWNIKRVWSTDWFRNPQQALEPIVSELKKLRHELSFKPVYDDNSKATEEGQIESIFSRDDILELSVRENLEEFNKNEISRFFPHTDDRRRLLSPNMIKLLSTKCPTTKSEYLSEIPAFMREVVDKHEENKYLISVLDIISNDIENGEWIQ